MPTPSACQTCFTPSAVNYWLPTYRPCRAQADTGASVQRDILTLSACTSKVLQTCNEVWTNFWLLGRWYGDGDPKTCFVERKTHRESWKGEESVKERFTLPEHKMVPFLEGEYTLDKAVADLEAKVGPTPILCPTVCNISLFSWQRSYPCSLCISRVACSSA